MLLKAENDAEIKSLKRREDKNEVVRLFKNIFCDEIDTSPVDLSKKYIFDIINTAFPEAVISFSSSFETDVRKIQLVGKRNAKININGTLLNFYKGPGKDIEDMPYMGATMAGFHRQFLENAKTGKFSSERNIPETELESRIAKEIIGDPTPFMTKLREVADRLGYDKEFNRIQNIVAQITSGKIKKLKSEFARAAAKSIPYDDKICERMSGLKDALLLVNPDVLKERPVENPTTCMPFWESYFSNYIEGTKFELSEAMDIVTDNNPAHKRIRESHDILSLYKIVSNELEMNKRPAAPEEFVEVLRNRHKTFMEMQYPELAGQWKEHSNSVGNTTFVKPNLVPGTLIKGFDIGSKIDNPFCRALYFHYLTVIVHPFFDGNGRVARTIMNSELDPGMRIIVPTRYRDNYSTGLKSISSHENFNNYINTMIQCYLFTGEIDFSSMDNAKKTLEQLQAFSEHDEISLSERFKKPRAIPYKYKITG